MDFYLANFFHLFLSMGTVNTIQLTCLGVLFLSLFLLEHAMKLMQSKVVHNSRCCLVTQATILLCIYNRVTYTRPHRNYLFIKCYIIKISKVYKLDINRKICNYSCSLHFSCFFIYSYILPVCTKLPNYL